MTCAVSLLLIRETCRKIQKLWQALNTSHVLRTWEFSSPFLGLRLTIYVDITFITDASSLHLNGTQQMTALMPEDSRTQAEEVVVRFKTTRPRGLLLATSLENSSDRLQIYLEEGKARMVIHIGDREKVRSQPRHEFALTFRA